MSKKMFTLVLKQSRAGMPAGTTIQVASSQCTPDYRQIADECERLFGKKARDASHSSYWDIKCNV